MNLSDINNPLTYAAIIGIVVYIIIYMTKPQKIKGKIKKIIYSNEGTILVPLTFAMVTWLLTKYYFHSLFNNDSKNIPVFTGLSGGKNVIQSLTSEDNVRSCNVLGAGLTFSNKKIPNVLIDTI